MGQKTHPYGFRLGYNKPWKSRWYADRDYADLLHEDVKLRETLKDRLKSAGISSIDIERAANKLVIRLFTARPGIIIGARARKSTSSRAKSRSAPSAKCTSTSRKFTARSLTRNWWQNRSRCNSKSASLSGAPCARLWIRRCDSVARESRCGLADRLNGAEIARTEWYLQGRLPLQTLRADIDYGTAEAHTSYGVIGVKCWVYQGREYSGARTAYE